VMYGVLVCVLCVLNGVCVVDVVCVECCVC